MHRKDRGILRQLKIGANGNELTEEVGNIGGSLGWFAPHSGQDYNQVHPSATDCTDRPRLEMTLMLRLFCLWILAVVAMAASALHAAPPYKVSQDEELIRIETPQLSAAIRKKNYVTGVAAQSFVDKQTGFRDPGYGLDIVDWIMEPGSDEAYRDQLPKEMVYQFNNDYHGKTAKRSIEGPQICTQAKQLAPEVVEGKDFVAVKQTYQYHTAAPGKKTGSTWTQWLVFPAGKRYFVSMDRIDSVNSSDAMFLRLDMPGHIKHKDGDSFSEIYLSYHGRIPVKEFLTNFAPDEKFNYRRDKNKVPKRMIRAIHLRDTESGKAGPWLAGMTLQPDVVSEAWCHQRGYVCMIEEFGGRPIKAGESFSAAFIVGYFDSIEEMEKVYDEYRGASGLEVTPQGWKLIGARK